MRLAVGAERATGFQRDVHEFSVFLVLIKSAGGGIVGHVNIGPAIIIKIGGQDAQAEGSVGLKNSGGSRNIGESAVAVVVIKNIFATLEPRRAACDHHAFIEARARFRHRRGRQVHIDIVGDEEIELAIAVVVHEGAAGIPALAIAGDAGFFADVRKSAVAVVVKENVFAEVSDEQVFEAVVVVVANADALSPTGVGQASFRRDVGESAIAIIFEQMRVGSCPAGKPSRRQPFTRKISSQPSLS